MQVDMHYYGTLAMALAAGIPKEKARIIAYASQFVDDSSSHENGCNNDGGMLVTFTTSHELIDSAKTMIADTVAGVADYSDKLQDTVMYNKEIQRKVWVPNHFLPGGKGETLEERAICQRNSEIANIMFDEHIDYALKDRGDYDYGLHLLGVAAHVYMDTFSHYGFSGFSSDFNRIKSSSMKVSGEYAYPSLLEKTGMILKSEVPFFFLWDKVKSDFAEGGDSALGHGAVMSLPDMPFLKWEFYFEKPRPGNGCLSVRDNVASFAEGCKALYMKLRAYAEKKYADTQPVAYDDIRGRVLSVLNVVGDKETRSDAWYKSGLLPEDAPRYDKNEWAIEIEKFGYLARSEDGLTLDCYKFHQAATYHRYYVLKDLLPRHRIALY